LELITLGSPVIAEKSTNIHGINRRFRWHTQGTKWNFLFVSVLKDTT
jgi:hypothetical protein